MPWIISHPTLPLPRLVLITFGYIFLAEYKWSVVCGALSRAGDTPPTTVQSAKQNRKGNWYFWYLLTVRAIRSLFSTTISSCDVTFDVTWEVTCQEDVFLLVTTHDKCRAAALVCSWRHGFIGKFKFNKNPTKFEPTNFPLSCQHSKLYGLV